MKFRHLFLIAVGLAAAIWFIGQQQGGASAPKNAQWKVVGGLPDGVKTIYVEMDPQYAKDRREYDAAVEHLCRDRQICNVAFFLPGDRVPNQDSRTFFASGGWANYPVLASWWGNRNSGLFEFKSWDCRRAGEEGAPPSALCGEGVAEAYNAVLALAGRAGTGEACGWPKTNDAKLAQTYIANIKNPGRQQVFKEGFDLFYPSKGPDDRADCKKLRGKIDDAAKVARKTLGF